MRNAITLARVKEPISQIDLKEWQFNSSFALVIGKVDPLGQFIEIVERF